MQKEQKRPNKGNVEACPEPSCFEFIPHIRVSSLDWSKKTKLKCLVLWSSWEIRTHAKKLFLNLKLTIYNIKIVSETWKALREWIRKIRIRDRVKKVDLKVDEPPEFLKGFFKKFT